MGLALSNSILDFFNFAKPLSNAIFTVHMMFDRPLSRRLDRCDRVIQNESSDPNGGNMCSFSAFLTRKSALIYKRGLRQRVVSLSLDCNGVFAIKAY